LLIRRQRQMCIRDSILTTIFLTKPVSEKMMSSGWVKP
jgi:hypothetical protein